MGASDRPLAGTRIVVTRTPDQAAEFIARLRGLGAEVLPLPTITIVEAEDTSAMDRAVAELDKFDWVVFTSRNAVRFLARRFKSLEIPADRLKHLLLSPKVAVIGSATSDEAWCVGFIPTYEAEQSNSEGLAEGLLNQLRGKRVLFPRSDRADSMLPKLFREVGAEVVEVVAYRTVAPAAFDATIVDAIRSGTVDVIAFFSPSAYENLVDEIGLQTLRRQSGKIAIASIGPVTSKAVSDDGLKIAIEASEASASGLCDAIAAHFRDRVTRGTTSL